MADVTESTPPTIASRASAAIDALHGDVRGGDIFARALVASTDETSLADWSADALAAEARAALAFLAVKPPGAPRVGLRRPAPSDLAAADDAAVLEILNDDMPFLLDSILGEVQARGFPVRLVLHPIFKTRRAPDGVLEAVTAQGDQAWSDGHQESYISVHLDVAAGGPADALLAAIAAVLDQVRVAVGDWKPMLARLSRAIADLRQAPATVPGDLLGEATAFLEWLAAGNFTFLGMREYALVGGVEAGELQPVEGQGLGLLRDPAMHVLRRGRELVALTPEVRRFFFGPSPLIVTKSNVVARVHRRDHMDYVGIKLYGRDGMAAGELRLIGLLTSSAYTQSPLQIPLLRRKVEHLVEAMGAPPESHAGKTLANVLATFPRDELFQIGAADLQRWVTGILELDTRPRVRLFTRVDRFDRFVSALVYVPRDRFLTTVRERIGAHLAERYAGFIAAFYPSFTEGPLARVHFIVGRREGVTPVVAEAELEREVAALVRTWGDQLADAIGRNSAAQRRLQARYGQAFPAVYAESFRPERALEDIRRMERLGPERPLAIDFYRVGDDAPGRLRAAIYRLDGPIRLSERVPVLENLGFSVIDERSYRLSPVLDGSRRDVVLHDMLLETAEGNPLGRTTTGAAETMLEDAFLAVMRGAAENDAFNRLVAVAGLTWREAALLRCYAAYLRQLGSPFGIRYVAETATRNPGIAQELVALFLARFDPDRLHDPAERERTCEAIRERIGEALGHVESLDEDRILRQIVTAMLATVRTNFFQKDGRGEPPGTIAMKLDGRRLDMAPEPRTYREIWVASPRVEAVHLRFAPIARGGIRWSDRPLDFRTEVLGLAKAQQVKNAVIVPAGAKGGFVPKLLPRAGSREQVQQEGIEAYKIFVSAMLDLTDNVIDGSVVPPARVVRHDGDDAYLVVAADKGTATFSDTANGLSTGHGFWLGDAFASGGSAGYDHKGIAITSRGAWECVSRHFRELGHDVQATPFRVVGVGDMSGDVFGNGMLRSDKIRLVAAFDHRDIFIDPDPDPAASYLERKRLFALSRSSWADYQRSLISTGGGVYSRSAKSVPLGSEARALLGLTAESATPAEVIRAILTCTTDLLFFGGIGTYVRATAEADQDAGDRANDAIRISAADLNARVIGEGANLGMTQRARIEAAGRGVRLNTDFIDNSAGVNCSDQEVNIKIALGPVVAAGRLTLADRNALLKEMTGDVAIAVLANNHQQSLALSLAERSSQRDIGAHDQLLRILEKRGLVERSREALPAFREIAARMAAGTGLSRPELAVLLSWAKIMLTSDLLASPVPDDPALAPLLLGYFPPALRSRFASDLAGHQLRREIVTTALTNAMLNRGGPAFAVRLAEEMGRGAADIASAFLGAEMAFGLADLWRAIDGLDGKIESALQLDLYERVREFTYEQTAVLARIGEHRPIVAAIVAAGGPELAAGGAGASGERVEALTARGVPGAVAARLGALDRLGEAPHAARLAQQTGASMGTAAQAVRAVRGHMRLSGGRSRSWPT